MNSCLSTTQISNNREKSNSDDSISPNRTTILRRSCHPIWKTIVLNDEEIEESQNCYWDEYCKEERHLQYSLKNFLASSSPRSAAFLQSSHAPFISSISFFTLARLKNASESFGLIFRTCE